MASSARAEHAVSLFRDGRACSQALLLAWADELGLDTAQAARLAAGLGGGLHMGGACGAFTGAVLVLGLAIGGEACLTREGRAPLFEAVRELAEHFRSRIGALDCPAVIGCDIGTAEGLALAKEEDRFSTRCVPAVRAAAAALEEVLQSRSPAA